MDRGFDTMHLRAAADVAAPDGSGMRVLLQIGRGGMAHFELAPGRVSRAFAHRVVGEICYRYAWITPAPPRPALPPAEPMS